MAGICTNYRILLLVDRVAHSLISYLLTSFRSQSCDHPPPKTVNYDLSLFLPRTSYPLFVFRVSTSVFLHSEFLELVFFILSVLTFVCCVTSIFVSISSSVSPSNQIWQLSRSQKLALIVRECRIVRFQMIFHFYFQFSLTIMERTNRVWQLKLQTNFL